MTDHLKDVQFDFIRYANCWEDADVLLEGLQLNEHSVVMSVGSAGDNTFSLLTKSPKKVIAIDISEVQLFLMELKIAAIRKLNREEYLAFAGFTESDNRLDLYAELKGEITKKAQQYWNQNQSAIETGIIHDGKFEKYFQLFRKDALRKVHNEEMVQQLFVKKSEAEQKNFYDYQWDTPEWKAMHQVFFGVQMMGEHGRDPVFLKHVKGNVSDILHERERAHYRSSKIFDNYFVHYIMLNRFLESYLPHYVRAENYESVKNNLNRLELHHGLIEEKSLEQFPECTHFNLSDIFEYMDDDLFQNFTQMLGQKVQNGARLAYWNLMISRRLSAVCPNLFQYQKQLSAQLSEKDKGYFYKCFIVDLKTNE